MTSDKTLMIVDDSKVSRMMIKAIVIDKYPELNIYEASNGVEALDLAKGKKIDYFSVDYNMPAMDGIEFIKQMKNQLTDAKFALLTANIQQATHDKANQTGAICINKPITKERILTMLEYFND